MADRTTPFKIHLSDILCMAAVALLCVIAWPMVHSADLLDWVLAFILLAGAARLLFEVTFNRYNIPTIATGYFAQNTIINALQQHAIDKADYRILDLGSGRGGFAKRIARALPLAKVTGIESALLPHLLARLGQRLLGPKNLHYQRGNFMPHNCDAYNGVIMFLDDTLTRKVGQKLRVELRPGTIVICNHFKLQGDWIPTETIVPPYSFGAPIYIYHA